MLPGPLLAEPGVDEDTEVRGITRAKPENGVRPCEPLGPSDCRRSCEISQLLNCIQILKPGESRKIDLQARFEPWPLL